MKHTPLGPPTAIRRVDLGPPTPQTIVSGEGAVWVLGFGNTEAGWEAILHRVDPATNEVRHLPLGSIYTAWFDVGAGAVWVGTCVDETDDQSCRGGQGRLLRIDPVTAEITAWIDIRGTPYSVIAGDGEVFVDHYDPDGITRVDAATNTATIAFEEISGRTLLEAGHGTLWAVEQVYEKLGRLDPASGSISATIDVYPCQVLFAAGSVWIYDCRPLQRRRLFRVDPSTNEITATIVVDQEDGGPLDPGGSIASDGISLWWEEVSQSYPRITQVDPYGARLVGDPIDIPPPDGSVDLTGASQRS